MAINKCGECGGNVSSSAIACPHCGAKVPKKVGVLGWFFALVVVLPIAWYFGSGIGDYNRDTGKSPNTSSSAAPPAALVWQYGEHKDEMTGKPVRYASLRSPDKAFFDFPYKLPGGSTLWVFIRKSDRGGEDVYFKIDKGQILCPITSCSFNLKVGDGQIQKIRGLGVAHGGSDLIFAADAKRMKQVLADEKPFKVEIPFYKSGDHTFSFDPKGLRWP